MHAVISLGGSILAPEKLDIKYTQEVAAELKKIVEKGHSIMVVTGGGARARNYIEAARQLKASEAYCDVIGIEVTRLNARILISALGNSAYPEPAKNFEEAVKFYRPGRIVVMGGTHIGHTTDSVSAMLAEYTGADLLIIATDVDGIYTSDPKIDPKAKKIDKISAKEFSKFALEHGQVEAGSTFVVDPHAAKIIERSKIRTVVINGRKLNEFERIIEGKSHTGTEILPR